MIAASGPSWLRDEGGASTTVTNIAGSLLRRGAAGQDGL